MDLFHEIMNLINKCKYYEDLYDIIWKLFENKDIKPVHKKCNIGLFNIPCGGFGDIIVCKTLYDYLKKWYPQSTISICTTTPEKFKQLGVDSSFVKLYSKTDNNECLDYDQCILKKKIKFDCMVIVPIINKIFNINQFKKCIPYSNVFNTFTMSEYNGEFPPYTLPIGVGEGHLGILLNDFKIKQQTLIKKPYAMVYIQPSPEWGIHSKYCFLSYLEMICKKYNHHRKFQVIIPQWISNEIEYNPQFTSKIRKIVKEYYKHIKIIYPDTSEVYLLQDDIDKSCLTFRSDLLPQQRNIFISLMKDSVKDILVTGDQSITDIISCYGGKAPQKIIWYQIAPWKHGFAYYLYKELPNKHYKSFHTSCGTLQSIDLSQNWKEFFKNYDFRIHGKKRMDSIMIGIHTLKNHKLLNDLLYIIEHSRYLETAQKKIKLLK
jgi:hypothetical protein